MSAIRITILSVVLVLFVTATAFFAFAPSSAKAAQPATSCPAPSQTVVLTIPGPSQTFALTTDQLWKILNGRYERRVRSPY